jgi:hypothetical protein
VKIKLPFTGLNFLIEEIMNRFLKDPRKFAADRKAVK